MTAFKKQFFGRTKQGHEAIYLSAPSWDCGWYWSFGYLGNNRCHYHLDGYQVCPNDGRTHRNINMFDALRKDYDLCDTLRDDSKLWLFCELALTAYTLKENAELLRRGGSHMTVNPIAELIKNETEVTRINKTLLPAIFAEIDKLFEQ